MAMLDPESLGEHPKGDLVLALLGLARESGIELDELAIRWMSGRRGVDTMLVGISSIEHLLRNVRLAEMSALPHDLCVAIEGILARPAPVCGDGG